MSSFSASEVRYVPRRIGYHAAHSGYDILFPCLGIEPARSAFWASVGSRMPAPIAWRLWNLRPQGTNSDGLSAELGALPWVRHGRRMTHFIYGEDTFFYTPLWTHPKHKLVATYHFEPDRLVQRVSPASIRALSAVVVVGLNQIDYFRRFFPLERIFHIPHHVDSEFFVPSCTRRQEDSFKVVFAGRGNRDFDTLRDVIKIANRKGANICFDLVLPDVADHSRFDGLSGVACHRGLSDDALLSLYQQADLGLMPVVDCTANNSLLEMMASGLPIVGTRVGAMPDYAGIGGVELVRPRDPDQMFQAVWALLADSALRRQMGQVNRARACAEFSMVRTCDRMAAVYTAMLSD